MKRHSFPTKLFPGSNMTPK